MKIFMYWGKLYLVLSWKYGFVRDTEKTVNCDTVKKKTIEFDLTRIIL